MTAKRIFLVAAEPSGDALAGELAVALKAALPGVGLAGVGGRKLAAAGVESQVSIDGLSVLGLTEGLAALKTVNARAQETAEAAAAFKPDMVILIDSWGFTLRAAKAMRLLLPNIPLVKMIGPQVFATRPGRAKTVAQVYDALLCIHEFEVPYYEGTGLPIWVIGNPAITRAEKGDGAAFRARHGLENKKIVLLLPGSRAGEIKRVCPTFEAAASALARTNPDVHIVTVLAPNVSASVQERAANWQFPYTLVPEDEKADAFASATLALACSGTVTTEVALQGVPLVVGYRLGAISAFIILNVLLKSKYVTLLNIAAGSMIVPEFLQGKFTPEAVVHAARPLLDDAEHHRQQVEAQNAALDKMGRNDAPTAKRAAAAILELLAVEK